MYEQVPANQDAAGLRIGVVVSRYHEAITAALQEGATGRFIDAGGRPDDLRIIAAPGSFELVAICAAAVHHAEFDAIVALGCVISGETRHDRHICEGLIQGLTRITLDTGVPIAFGVLTCQTHAQARARAGGPVGNKGAEAMAAAIETANTIRALRGAENPSPERT